MFFQIDSNLADSLVTLVERGFSVRFQRHSIGPGAVVQLSQGEGAKTVDS